MVAGKISTAVPGIIRRKQARIRERRYDIVDSTGGFVTIYIEEKGTVLREKPLMALEAGSGKILAFGAEAESMAENPAKNVEIAAPLAGGKITDYKMAVKLFLCLLHKAGVKGGFFHRPQIALSVPGGVADEEKKVWEDVLYQAGAGNVFVSEMETEQLVTYLRGSSEKSLKGFHTVIGITKDA